MDPYQLPVAIQTIVRTAPNLSIKIPQIVYLPKQRVQITINAAIRQRVEQLFDMVKQEGYYQLGKTKYNGTYEIKNNQRGILSLTLSNFAFMYQMAHPVDHLTSITTDVRTGKIYALNELFKPNSPYVERISEIIKQQLTYRDIPLFEPFEQIKSDQDYYIADKALVIYFQRYEIAPRPAGYPMFPISIYELEDIIDKQGPLGMMIVD